MSQKWIIILFLAIIFGLASGVGFWLLGKKETPKFPLADTASQTSKIELGKTVNYYDKEVGYSFDYPEKITVKDNTPDDNVYYVVLELVSNKLQGKMQIIMRDTQSNTIDDWFGEDKEAPRLARVSGATKLGDISAKQYTYAEGNKRMLLTVAVEDGVLYRIEAPDNLEWEEVYTIITSSFKQGAPVSASQPLDTKSGVIYEEEEIVE